MAYLPTLSGDGGSSTAFHFLNSQEGQTYILALAGGASQGILYTWPYLLTVEDGEWAEHPIPNVDQNKTYLFLATAHLGQPLVLTALEDDGQLRGLHQYTERLDDAAFSLLWSEGEGAFVPLDENWMTVS